MGIYLCSPDEQLATRLDGCGAAVRLQDVEIEKAASGVLVVDLKYHSLPDNAVFEQAIVTLAELPQYDEAMTLLQRGVRGYGNRHMRQENLVQAIEAVSSGQVWLPPDILARMISVIGAATTPHQPGGEQPQASLLALLSGREQEVARFVAQGMTNQQIADTMYVSLRTVKAHLSSIYDKTGMRNRLELGLKLKESGELGAV